MRVSYSEERLYIGKPLHKIIGKPLHKTTQRHQQGHMENLFSHVRLPCHSVLPPLCYHLSEQIIQHFSFFTASACHVHHLKEF